MRRRQGITLIEVLVAIFIMAIGLLAILTLFPLGALRMGQALADDRAAAAANAGANVCDAFNLRNDPAFFSTTTGVNLFLNPGAAYGNPPVAANTGGGHGYPVYVDPWGIASGAPALLGGDIPRAAPAGIPGTYGPVANAAGYIATMAPRYFTLPDDMGFAPDGLPDTGNPLGSTAVQRGGRYTWAYMLLRTPPAAQQAAVDLTVVVYAGRPTSVPSGENTFAAVGNNGDTQVVLSWNPANQQPPNLHRGGWVLDTTADVDPSTGIFLGVHGAFYRVAAVTQPTATNMVVELEKPLSAPVNQVNSVNSITILDNVLEVFSRGTGQSSKWEFRNDQP